MALKLALRLKERIIVGGAILQNAGPHVAHVLVENTAPILRGGEVLRPEDANTPCRRIYLTIQLMYVEPGSFSELHPRYWQLVEETVHAVPSMRPSLERISMLILAGDLYAALKLTRRLVQQEEKLLTRATEALNLNTAPTELPELIPAEHAIA
jgi:flagellar biosynthesis repressor protein FlbT